MARLWTCGFELQSLAPEVEVMSLTGTGSISTTIHREGAASFRSNPAAATGFIENRLDASGINARTFHRFYLYIAALPSATTTVYSLGQSGYFPVHVRVTPAGMLQLRDNQNTVDVGTASAPLATGRWYRVEIDAAESGAIATPRNVVGYLDGVNFSGTASIAGSTGFSRIRAGVQTTATVDLHIDDIAINTTTGTAQNGLPGPGSVVHLHPDSAGDANGWATAVGGTAGAANNYTRVSEATPDDTTSYNQTTAAGTTTIDDYNLQTAASAGIGANDTINLVAVGGRVGSNAVTAASLVYRLKSQPAGATVESGSVSVALNGWATHKAAAPYLPQLTSYTNPQTGGAWTPALLDTAQIGVRGDVSQATQRRVSTLWALVEFVPSPGAPLASLVDDFEDGTVDPVKWSGSYGTYSETGGRARVACDTGYSAVASAPAYHLRDSHARCRLYPPAAGGAVAEAWAQLLITTQTLGTDAVIEVNSVGGSLGIQMRSGYADPDAVSLPYDPVAHAWVQIRETAGSLYWETSADGLAWTVRRTDSSPAWVANGYLQVQLISHRDGGVADVAEYESFNITPVAPGTGIPLAELADDCSSPVVDTARWPDNYNEAPGGPLPDQPDGRARVPCTAGAFAAFASAEDYTLAGSHAAVQVVPAERAGAVGDVFTQLIIRSSVVGTQVVFEVNASTNLLLMVIHVGYIDEVGASIPYDPVEHAWLRVREDAGTLYWETSADGRAWTVRHSVASPPWVSAGNLALQLLAYRDDGSGNYAYFDNVNVTPTLADGYFVGVDWASSGAFDGEHDDVTSQVLARNPVSFSYGRDQSRQLAPPAIGSLSFSVCNAERIYSPENPDSPLADDLSPASPIRVDVTLDDVVYPLMRGRVDDFEVHPDRTDRSVDITGLDDLSLLQTDISTEVYEARRTGFLIGVILDSVGWTAPRDLDLGATHVPWWWAEGKDAFTALTELLDSEGPPSIAYVAPDGTFTYRDRHHRLLRENSLIPQATFAARLVDCESPPVSGFSYLPPFEYSHGWRDIINDATFDIEERRPDEPSVVWESDDTISLTIGQSTQVHIQTSDPVRDVLDLVPGTDIIYSGPGVITSTVSRRAGQAITVNLMAHGGPVTITRLQVRAQPIPVVRTVQVTAEDAVSIQQHRRRTYPESAPWAGQHDAYAIAQLLFAQYAQRRPTVQLHLVSADRDHLLQILTRGISDLITIKNGELGLDADFHIERVQHTLRRMRDGDPDCGAGPVHYAVLGCERYGQQYAANPFTFDKVGAGFDDGVFDPIATDDPSRIFIFDHPVQGCFDVGVFAT
ncbi:hypothetical protein [Streptomyces iconiensis]|uniref:Uncharacterized protein n=1 Tax=Streptomyces iconiensis TaxID=1384038 RepID=A0ABT7A9B0_9ACTN|nr:hypothetical protein [Streptomyces iconiensis]MDJ1137930.1 hypothetical protein [Streptomyces iconiensis]